MMNDKLKDLIQKAKKSLNTKPNGIIFGELREGNKGVTNNIQAFEQFFYYG
ncbi:hypothetical protein [Thermoflavimicrobium dichotomicum]|uniref:Uncharacterized protein n=1 Tax=Thermoflavimicrobium dichotomicum TaxID=46223 RepID=A0A1I3UDX1_9BACL|nr:hypothetical protein [Thermoflavimicrobium dichotomicum]SFJ81122.1 hypothetical protein SAMN05421852_1241 [Thermoflavimicrobium dichotomicum]